MVAKEELIEDAEIVLKGEDDYELDDHDLLVNVIVNGKVKVYERMDRSAYSSVRSSYSKASSSSGRSRRSRASSVASEVSDTSSSMSYRSDKSFSSVQSSASKQEKKAIPEANEEDMSHKKPEVNMPKIKKVRHE